MNDINTENNKVKVTSAVYSRLKSEIAELKERNYKLAEILDNSRPVYIEKRQWTLMITQLEKAQSLEQTLRLRIVLMSEY